MDIEIQPERKSYRESEKDIEDEIKRLIADFKKISQEAIKSHQRDVGSY